MSRSRVPRRSLSSSWTGMLSMTASDMPCRSTSSRSAAMRSSGQGCPTGMSKSAPTIPRTAGICLMYASGIGSRGPNHRNVIKPRPPLFARDRVATVASSSRHSQTRSLKESLYLAARHQAEIARDAVLERGGRRRKADRIFPSAFLEAAHDQAGAECIAGANTIHDLHLVAWSAVNLAIGGDDRAPAVQQDSWILA